MEGGGEVTAPGYEEIITRSAPMLHSAPAQTLITILDIVALLQLFSQVR